MLKSYFVLLGIFLIQNFAFAAQNIYYNSYPNNFVLRNNNPYPYLYQNNFNKKSYYFNNQKNINHTNRYKKVKRNKKYKKNNFISLFNKKGTLTGYSTPIQNDILSKFNFDNDQYKTKLNSPNCSTDLFSSPTVNQYFGRNGNKIIKDGGVGAKTGVTIIYD